MNISRFLKVLTSTSDRAFKQEGTKTLVAVIPAYNEESSIGAVVTSIKSIVDKVFVVDDGSYDSTAARASEAGAEVIYHDRNRGVGIALQTGYESALAYGADVLVQLDADGQHEPSDISDLLGALDPSVDIVIGSRFVGETPDGYGLARRSGIRFFSFLCSVLGGSPVYDVTSGFRIYRASSLLKLPPIRGRHWALEQTLTAMRLNLRIREVEIRIPPRSHGLSQFQPSTAALYPLRMGIGILRALFATSRSGIKQPRSQDSTLGKS